MMRVGFFDLSEEKNLAGKKTAGLSIVHDALR
jgi:hypothetical protein